MTRIEEIAMSNRGKISRNIKAIRRRLNSFVNASSRSSKNLTKDQANQQTSVETKWSCPVSVDS